MANIQRLEVVAARLGIGVSKFYDQFMHHGDGRDSSPAPTFRACALSAWAPRRSDSSPMKPMR